MTGGEMKYILLVLVFVSISGCGIWPLYRVWEQRQEGMAELAKADFSKQGEVEGRL